MLATQCRAVEVGCAPEAGLAPRCSIPGAFLGPSCAVPGSARVLRARNVDPLVRRIELVTLRTPRA